MDDFPREVLSYQDLRRIAEGFLQQYHPSASIPVPIEEIAEAKLGIDIVPVPGLQETLRSDDYGVVGFISRLKRENIPFATVRDRAWDIVLEHVAKDFEVSADVIQRRVEKDTLRNELESLEE